MIHAVRRLAQGGLIFAGIAALAFAAALLHYALSGGDLSPIREGAGGLFVKGREWTEQASERIETLRPPPPAETSAPPENVKPLAEAKISNSIRVYFAPCPDRDDCAIERALVELLSGARESILGAFYEFNLPAAADVLIERAKAGVDVRLVSDSSHEEEAPMQRCIAAGIPVVFDRREPFMHDKFCVVDGEWVWSGSTNITENCLYRNDNDSLLIASGDLADNYTAEFLEMAELGEFGRPSPSDTPHPEAIVDGVTIECYFAPEDGVRAAIIDEIRDARETIDVMAFSFTSEPIAEALAERIGQGVHVRVLFETRGMGSRYSRDDYLKSKGASVFADTNPYAMHHKAMILDSRTVITGSYNFSESAETKNDENLLILHSPEIAAAFAAEFARLAPDAP